MTPEEILTRIEEIVSHSMPDDHKLPRIAALIATFRKNNPKTTEPQEDTTDADRSV